MRSAFLILCTRRTIEHYHASEYVAIAHIPDTPANITAHILTQPQRYSPLSSTKSRHLLTARIRAGGG